VGYACHLILVFKGKGKASLSTNNSVTDRIQVGYAPGAGSLRVEQVPRTSRYPPIGRTANSYGFKENEKRER
jgi:hypothetical protein